MLFMQEKNISHILNTFFERLRFKLCKLNQAHVIFIFLNIEIYIYLIIFSY